MAAMFLIYIFKLKDITSFPVFVNIVVGFIGLFVLVSNQALIWHEKFRPTKLMGLIIIVSSFLVVWAIKIIPFRFVEYVSYYGDMMFFGFLIMAYLAVKRKPYYDVDFIIILGCSISKEGHLLPLLKGRVNKAIRFAWEQEVATGKPGWYVPSGGQGKDEIMSEGSAMELYLLSHGPEQYEIFPEKKSKNTAENMIFSKKVIDDTKRDSKVAFCTTNYHVFRSGILAQKAGLDAQGISSTTRWYFWPNALIREFIGFLSLFPMHHIVISIALIVLSFFV